MTELEFTALYLAQRDNVTRFSASILGRSRVPNADIEAEAICADVFVECLLKMQAGCNVTPALLIQCAKFRSLDFADRLTRYSKFIFRLKSMASHGSGD